MRTLFEEYSRFLLYTVTFVSVLGLLACLGNISFETYSLKEHGLGAYEATLVEYEEG